MTLLYTRLGLTTALIVILYFLSKGHAPRSGDFTLRKVFVAFRHGSRAPRSSYANDMYSAHNQRLWPNGPEELTKTGKRECYKLGQRLKERYGEFLGGFYDPSEVRAYATQVERALMSGQLVLAGLFPPVGYQVWDSELNWQPVPLYSEYVFNNSVGGHCPRFKTEMRGSVFSQVLNMSRDANETLARVMKHAGEPNAKPYEVFHRVWDSVYFQEKANFPLPKWLSDVYPAKMKQTALDFIMMFIRGSEAQRKLILHNYAYAIRNFLLADDKRKMEIHSWHDLNNVALMRTLGIKVTTYPEPTSCIAVELHELRGVEYFEVYYYDNYKTAEPRKLEMPCGITCSVEDLDNLVNENKVENYTLICNDAENVTTSKHFRGINV